jgi:hypothetical protein
MDQMDHWPERAVLPSPGRAAFWLMLLLIAPTALAQTSSLTCSNCPGATLPAFVCRVAETHQQGSGCIGFNNCQAPVLSGPFVEVVDTGGGTFEARLVLDAIAYWNSEADAGPNSKLDLWWTQAPTATHPTTSLCENNSTDRTYTYLAKTGLTCAGAPYDFGVYSLRATVCPGSSCQRTASRSGMAFQVTAEDLGCKIPRKNDCKECQSCLLGGGGPLGGGPPAGGGEGSGAGGPGLPGTPAWNQTFGRYWSHDYAERIVVDPDASHVWLLTDRREPSGDCGSWTDDCGTDQCVQRESRLYNNPSDYHYLGTNSNTFAGTIARTCGLQPPPIVGPVRTPGWYFPPAPPPVPFNPGRPDYRESPL